MALFENGVTGGGGRPTVDEALNGAEEWAIEDGACLKQIITDENGDFRDLRTLYEEQYVERNDGIAASNTPVALQCGRAGCQSVCRIALFSNGDEVRQDTGDGQADFCIDTN